MGQYDFLYAQFANDPNNYTITDVDVEKMEYVYEAVYEVDDKKLAKKEIEE